MKVEFEDIYNSKLKVYRTPSGYSRIDIEIADHMEKGDPCVSMNDNQAKILIAALQDLLDSYNE